jgi:hypothetical protein
MRSSADSVTTPSWREEAQAESSHAMSKTSMADNAARLFMQQT